MHELDITRSIAKEASDRCKKEGILAGDIFLELGSLSNYKREPIEFFYDALKDEHKELGKSNLKITNKKGKAQCLGCKEKFEIKDFWNLKCPKCESRDIEIIEGEDIKLIKISKWQKR